MNEREAERKEEEKWGKSVIKASGVSGYKLNSWDNLTWELNVSPYEN